MSKRIAYLGPPGTFTEEAALRYAAQAKLMPFASIPAVAAAVESGMADEGVVPIENSLEGSVNDTLDLLIHESRLSISREMVLPIRQCLLARPGTQAAEIQAIFSHPQALAQCRHFIERCFPKAQLVAALSTAAAVEEMKTGKAPAAAIAPERAAQLYSVDILASGIQDNPSNATRFVVLAREDHPPTGNDRTSLCFAFSDDRPGLLHTVLGAFARRGINLAKIESRPTKESPWSYIFLADLEGHREDPKVKEALDEVRAQTSLLKLFGSYPRFTEQS